MRLTHPLSVVAGKTAETWRLFGVFVRRVPSLGFLAAATIFFCEASVRKPLAQLVKPLAVERVRVRPAGYHHAVKFRREGTDGAVFSQVLIRREYLPVASLKNIRLIVDCGANIGLSAYYLLHCYPQARLIAVEPDPENCALCRQNLAPFSNRVVVFQAAVWSENRLLRIVPNSRTGGAWSLAVEPWPTGDVEGLTIPEILRRANVTGPIDLLKADIEGAETELFRDASSWLDQTRNMAIELHTTVAEATLTRALARYQHERLQVNETTFIYGVRPTES